MNHLRHILYITLIILLFAGCKKYNEGYYIGTVGAKHRISGNWNIENYKVNDNNYSQLFADSLGSQIHFYLSKPGDGVDNDEISILKSGNFPIGVWSLQNDKKELLIEFYDYGDSLNFNNLEPFASYQVSTWIIKKLTKKEFNLETDFDNKHYRLELSKTE